MTAPTRTAYHWTGLGWPDAMAPAGRAGPGEPEQGQRPSTPGGPLPEPGLRALAAELARRVAERQHRLVQLIGPAEVTQLLGLLGRLESALASGLPAEAEEG